MKLFDTQAVNRFVFAVVSKNAKESTPPTYVAIQALDFESALNQIEAKQQRSAYPYPLGKYDELGRYCTYCPPVDSIALGRFVLHPAADTEYKATRWTE